MNRVEEFLLEEAVDDLVLSCDSKGEYIYASDMMQKYAGQQFDIQRVSQQRELLEAFVKQIKEDNELTEEITFQDINKCMASNCG